MHTVQGPDPVDRQLRWQVDHDASLPGLAGTIPEVKVVQGDLADDGVQLVTRDDAYRRERPRHIVDHRFLDLGFRFRHTQSEGFAVVHRLENEPGAVGAYPKRSFQRSHRRVLSRQLNVESGETQGIQLIAKSVKHAATLSTAARRSLALATKSPSNRSSRSARKIRRRNYFARCKITDEWKGIAIMIKIKFLSKLALTLAAGCLSVGMLGVDASAQTPRALITVIIGDNHAFNNMDLGVAAKLLVSNLCGVDERDAKEILELAAINNQKIVAICPKTGAVFHIIP